MARGARVKWEIDALGAGQPTWMRDARCKAHPEICFFPQRGESAAPAKAVCRRCAVSSECLAFALVLGDRLEGIWAGTSPLERRTLRRQAAKTLSL